MTLKATYRMRFLAFLFLFTSTAPAQMLRTSAGNFAMSLQQFRDEVCRSEAAITLIGQPLNSTTLMKTVEIQAIRF